MKNIDKASIENAFRLVESGEIDKIEQSYYYEGYRKEDDVD